MTIGRAFSTACFTGLLIAGGVLMHDGHWLLGLDTGFVGLVMSSGLLLAIVAN